MFLALKSWHFQVIVTRAQQWNQRPKYQPMCPFPVGSMCRECWQMKATVTNRMQDMAVTHGGINMPIAAANWSFSKLEPFLFKIYFFFSHISREACERVQAGNLNCTATLPHEVLCWLKYTLMHPLLQRGLCKLSAAALLISYVCCKTCCCCRRCSSRFS